MRRRRLTYSELYRVPHLRQATVSCSGPFAAMHAASPLHTEARRATVNHDVSDRKAAFLRDLQSLLVLEYDWGLTTAPTSLLITTSKVDYFALAAAAPDRAGRRNLSGACASRDVNARRV